MKDEKDKVPEEGVELGYVEVEVVPVAREFVWQVGSILGGGWFGIWAANLGERLREEQVVVVVAGVVVFGVLLYRGITRALGDWGLEGGLRVGLFFLSLPGPIMAMCGAVWGWVHLGKG